MLPSYTQKIPAFLIIIITLCLEAGAETNTQYTQMGTITSLDKDGYNITFNCENGKVKVSFLTDNLVRVHMSPDGNFPPDDLHLDQNGPYFIVNYDWPGVKYTISEEFDYDLEGDIYKISAGQLIIKVRKTPFKITFADKFANTIISEKPGLVNAGLGYAGSKVFETMSADDDEHFFGFGAYNNPLDVRGVKMVCYARELEKHHRSGGFPTPFFYSSNGYGIFFNNLDDDVTFEMVTTPGEYSFSATSGKMEGWDMDYYFIYGPKFSTILKTYIDIVGKPILPEKWYFGHIQHHCCTWLADTVMQAADKYRQGDWPCDVLIMDHQALKKNLEWDVGYENYKQMYKHIDEKGFKTSFSTALFDDIYDWKKYDPTVPEIVEHYWSLHVPVVIDGMDFWRQDNGERSMNYTGKTHLANGYEAHNLFGALWAKNLVEGQEQMSLYGRPVIARGGPIGGHRYILPWSGDTPHGLEFIDIDINYIRGGGLAGYSSISVDLGGFKNRGQADGLEEQTVVRRIIDFEPFVPISKYQGDGDASSTLPWLLTKKQQDLLRYYLKLRYRTLPYRYSAAIEAHLTGRPILAPLVFDYQDDENTYDKDFHLLMGKSILVAPVTEDTDKWSVYLPAGKWTNYWTGDQFTGPQTVNVDAPLYGNNSLPMFIKAGAIIPMMPDMAYIYEKAPDPITLDIYPDYSADSKYTLYDADSPKTPLKVTKTEFTCATNGDKITVSISPSKVAYQLSLHCNTAPTKVILDGKAIPIFKNLADYNKAKKGHYFGAGIFYGSDSVKTLNIKFPKDKGSRTIEITFPKTFAASTVTASKNAVEKQLTFEPRNHYLGNLYNFSPDDKWLAYDTRTIPSGIGSNSNIEMVNVETGEIVVLYETPDQTEFGPGCGSADFHPIENKVLFIHGLLNCNAQRPYWFTRRTCVVVDTSEPGKPIFVDARDVTPPFTPGALRGGTHAHQWSSDGKWIGFTYNDAIMAKLGEEFDLRTVGVTTELRPVTVDKDAQGENNDGIWFSALVVKVVPNPEPGSDQISRAFSDSWVGTNGYLKPDGTRQRARAFLGKTGDKKGNELVEVYIVDIPNRIDIPGDEGPLEGTETTFPMPPKGAKQRRLTFTENRKYPGISTTPRHWVRSSPDGTRISFLAKDDNGIAQVFFVSPTGSEPVQVTRHTTPIQSSINWNPDGNEICYVCDNSIFICDVRNGTSFGKTRRMTSKSESLPYCPLWSHDGKGIAFTRLIQNGRKEYKQIFLLKL